MAKRIVKENEAAIIIDETNEDIALQSVLTDLGGEVNAEVKVYRAGQMYHGKLAYLFTCRPEEFSLDILRDNFGGGEFRVHVKKDGLFVPGGNRNIIVEVPKIDKTKEEVKSLSETMEKGFTLLGQLISDNQARDRQTERELLLQLTARNQQPQISPQESFNQTLQMFGQMMSIMQQMRPEQTDPTNAILKGIELAREFGERGESSTNDVLIELAKSFGRPIVDMVKKAQEIGIPQLPNTPPVNFAHKPVAITNSQVQAQAKATITQPQSDLKTSIEFLVSKAKANKDPDLWADMVLDEVEDHQMLLSFLQAHNWFENLKTFSPEIENYRNWFFSLRSSVLEGIVGESEIDLTSPESPGIGEIEPAEIVEETNNVRNVTDDT